MEETGSCQRSGGRRDWMKEGERISAQIICTYPIDTDNRWVRAEGVARAVVRKAKEGWGMGTSVIV